MNTIYGKILWRTSLPVLLLLFLAVSCKQSEQHSSWEKKYDSFYRSVTDSLTTHYNRYVRWQSKRWRCRLIVWNGITILL